MDREKIVLEYIQANPRCTKTKVKDSMPFAPGTTDKILKKLIEEDEEVIYEIDKVNPRIHHLLINDKDKFAMITQLLGQTTSVKLTTDEWISFPINRKFPIIDATVLDDVKKLIAGSKWY